MSLGNHVEMPFFCRTNCPVQCDIVTDELNLRIAKAVKNHIAQNVLMGDNPAFDAALQAALDKAPSGLADDPEKAKEILRSVAAQDLDTIDARIAVSVEKRRQLGETCVNPLLAVAHADNGQWFEVELCSAPGAY